MTKDPLRHALLTARVPRYTSYPPADRFNAEVTGAAKARWIETLAPGDAISLYVHVPFCRRLCWFCACRTQGTSSDAPLDRYLDHLEIEIDMTRRLMPEGVRFSALHLGGGTPTLLSPDRMARLTGMVRDAFDLTGAEVSVEIDPCECDDARLDALVELGLTRASIGVQDFDPLVQAAIGRTQSAEQTREAVEGLRARGIDSVNFDLLYGLPHQSAQRLSRTLETVLEMSPDRIALYGYAHVPWAARRQKMIPEAALPSPEDRLVLADLARACLTGAGYVPVGIDHFAKPEDSLALAAENGTMRRNFQGYTTDAAQTLLALGPSAISQFPQGFVQNAPATEAWQKQITAGRIPASRGIALTEEDRAIATIIERLMCDAVVDLGTLPATLAPRLTAAAEAALALYEGAGEIVEGHLRLFDIRAARLVAHAIETDMRGVEPEPSRYSQAS